MTTEKREELGRLRKGNRVLKVERDFFKKSSGLFRKGDIGAFEEGQFDGFKPKKFGRFLLKETESNFDG